MGMINDKKQSIDKTEAQEKVLRCMFYNIYGYGDNPNNKVFPGPMDLRQQNQCKIIEKYAPQLIGFQEYDTDFRKGMAPRMSEMGYAEVPVTEQGSCIYPEGKKLRAVVLSSAKVKTDLQRRRTFPRYGFYRRSLRYWKQRKDEIFDLGCFRRFKFFKNLYFNQHSLYVERAAAYARSGGIRAHS